MRMQRTLLSITTIRFSLFIQITLINITLKESKLCDWRIYIRIFWRKLTSLYSNQEALMSEVASMSSTSVNSRLLWYCMAKSFAKYTMLGSMAISCFAQRVKILLEASMLVFEHRRRWFNISSRNIWFVFVKYF